MNDNKLDADCDNHITIQKDMVHARKELGISQRKLSTITGISQFSICGIETGNFNPSMNLLKRIALALGKKLVVRLE